MVKPDGIIAAALYGQKYFMLPLGNCNALGNLVQSFDKIIPCCWFDDTPYNMGLFVKFNT